ncbi:hypothetical protein O7627_29690 [Solwaraspora sp. WMMD1047]|uniref:hypothetical protein n=1 Tax=Solwaraspora sp. WMMD1047 TaxID=3016102 RepID=UPI002417FAB5|nr:hypothetical protein [Solwaraspora sp. WMMD1047]MDG4833449.1 hypothetical protein [Solwaraspora sp. WMMD1047]
MGDPVVARLRAAAKAGDWRTIAELVSAAEHPDDHYFRVREAAFTTGVQEWVDDWVAAEPRSTLPLLVKGAHAISWAWEARGSGRANTVGEAAYKIFFKRLKVAEDCLDDVTDRDSDSATAWAFLVVLGRARQLGIDETRRRFDKVRRRHPWHVEAHEQMLQQLCRKWGGSHELMHGFAAETLAAMPAGSLLGQLTPAAHLEHWLDLPEGEDEGYLTTAEVRADLNAAADRSVRHPDFVRRAHWPTVHNSFAMAFSLNGDWSAAREQFDVIGDLMTEWPWQYMANKENSFVRFRDQSHR